MERVYGYMYGKALVLCVWGFDGQFFARGLLV